MAVVAVALAARQGTRQDFTRLQDFETRAHGVEASSRTAELAARLQDRCCQPPVLDAAVSSLGADAVLLVTDVAKGTLIASAGGPLLSADRVTTWRSGGVLALEVTLKRGAKLEQVALRFRQPGTSLRLADGRDALLYIVTFPNPERRRHTEAFLIAVDRRLQFTTAFVGIFALALTWAIVRSSVRPLEELRAATRDLARGRLGTRVRPRGSREVVELGRDFNAMVDELERQHVLRQRLLHDVAHELRTPLTALQCRLETVIDGLARDPSQAVRDLHEDVRHLGSLVDDLQDVALAEAGELRLSIADHAASDLVRSALRAAGLDGDARVRLDVPEALTLRADARRSAADPGEPAVQRQPAHARRRRHRHRGDDRGRARRGCRFATPEANSHPKSARACSTASTGPIPPVNGRPEARGSGCRSSSTWPKRTAGGCGPERRGRSHIPCRAALGAPIPSGGHMSRRALRAD